MARGRPSKKIEIIKCAKQLFQQCGYQATSIDQVVILSGVSKPTVYSNFASKQILWVEVMKQVIEEASLAIHNLDSSNQPFLASWVETWEVWSSCSVRLSLYRIMIGERVKMEAQALALFADFEMVLSTYLSSLKKNSGLSIDGSSYMILYFTSHHLFIDSALYPSKGNMGACANELLSSILNRE
jgi:AcrR family transcriptional regulator